MKTGPKYKICRRLDDNVFAKCETPKFQMSKARKRGKGGFGRRPRPKTEYGIQLNEKQKVRYTYNITEKQMCNYVKKAEKASKSDPVKSLYIYLESRLDNVIYRLGIVNTRNFARQVVTHGHICVNGKKINVPSMELRVGDIISIRKGSAGKTLFQEVKSKMKEAKAPNWLKVNTEKMEIEIIGAPELGDRSELNLDFGTVLEFYSRV